MEGAHFSGTEIEVNKGQEELPHPPGIETGMNEGRGGATHLSGTEIEVNEKWKQLPPCVRQREEIIKRWAHLLCPLSASIRVVILVRLGVEMGTNEGSEGRSKIHPPGVEMEENKGCEG